MFQPEIWKNYHAIELFPHHFSQFLMSEIGFSRTEVIGSPIHHARGFQRPIKLFIKEDPSFDTPVYSANTSVCDSVTPRYCRDTPGHLLNFGNAGSYSFRLPDGGNFLDECSGDSNFAYGTPNSLTSSESGFSESLLPRRFEGKVYIPPPLRFEVASSESDLAANSSQSQRDCLVETASSSEESPTRKYEIIECEDNTLDSTSPVGAIEEDTETEVKKEIIDIENTATDIKHEGKEITIVGKVATETTQENIDKKTFGDKAADGNIIDKNEEDEKKGITDKTDSVNIENLESKQDEDVPLPLVKNDVEMAIDSKSVEKNVIATKSSEWPQQQDSIKVDEKLKVPSSNDQSVGIKKFPTEAANSTNNDV